MSHLNMIIGVPFINAVKEVRLDFCKNEIVIPHTPSTLGKGEAPNLLTGAGECLSVEACVNGEPVTINPDTGAGNSALTAHYFSTHKNFVEANGRPDTLRSAGVGGIKIEKAYVLPDIRLTIGGTDHIFPEIFVSTLPSGSGVLSGTIGMDYFVRLNRLIINTKDMFVRTIQKSNDN